MESDANVSAFAAYNLETNTTATNQSPSLHHQSKKNANKKKGRKSMIDKSFKKLSESEIVTLLEKKKTELKRKLGENENVPKNKKQHKVSAVENGTPKKLLIQQSPKSSKVTKTPIVSTATTTLSMKNSIKSGEELFSWIINPIAVDNFMKTAWEKNPLFVDRKCPSYYEELISTQVIDRMLRQNRIEFTKNIDITSYRDGVRETHNPEGRAMPPTVWDFYSQGCSIRLLNPQTFIPSVHALNATLQEYFQCMTGANVYLTPANSQGFAPHYDDIEAFVLQIEGKWAYSKYFP